MLHPDLADAIGAAEDALTAALGRDVEGAARGERCRVEFDFDAPRRRVELAEQAARGQRGSAA